MNIITEIQKEQSRIPMVAVTDIQKESKESFEEWLQMFKIHVDEEIPEPPTCLSVLHGNDEVPIYTLGNFSAVIGKAKSKKTFMMSMAIATALKNGTLLSKFKGSLPEEQRTVLLIDTEQSKYHLQRVVKRICALSGIEKPKDLHTYGLRSQSITERIRTIEYLIESTPNLGFVVIDGIRDLVADINQLSEANHILYLLLKWSQEKNIHISVVIHQNKGDNNARGHLGSELTNKAETVLSVSKQENHSSKVEVSYARDKEFPPFVFSINEQGLPFISSDAMPAKRKKALTANDIHPDTHGKIINEMFKHNEELSRGELLPLLINAFAKINVRMADNRGKEIITRYISEEWIALSRTDGKKVMYKNMV
jgi:hypothetical protein